MTKTLVGRLIRDEDGQHLLAYAFIGSLTTLIFLPELVHPETLRTIGAHWKEMDRDRHPITRADVIL